MKFLKSYKLFESNQVFANSEDIKDILIELLDDNIVVICDLHDRNGKIGLSISKIENDMDNEKSILYLNNQSTHELSDKYLYNLIYNTKTDKYYLEEHDEYFEKIEVE